MYSNRKIMTSTNSFLDDVNKIRTLLCESDAVIIGAGAGLSASAGLTYSEARFENNFSDFIEKYHFSDMYSGGFRILGVLVEVCLYQPIRRNNERPVQNAV